MGVVDAQPGLDAAHGSGVLELDVALSVLPVRLRAELVADDGVVAGLAVDLVHDDVGHCLREIVVLSREYSKGPIPSFRHGMDARKTIRLWGGVALRNYLIHIENTYPRNRTPCHF